MRQLCPIHGSSADPLPKVPAEAEGGVIVQQGHAYDYQGIKVIALEPGPRATLVLVVSECPRKWISRTVRTSLLYPLPMRYFNDEVPSCNA